VLDDYHLVGSQPVHASLGFLPDHLTPGLHPVLASRADPPPGLARLRARGQLTELRDAELRFTAPSTQRPRSHRQTPGEAARRRHRALSSR